MAEEEKPTYSPPQPPHSLSRESKPLATSFNEANTTGFTNSLRAKDAETTGTTTQADELVIGGLGISGSIGGWDDTWTNSFTQQTTAISTGSGTKSNNTVAHYIASVTGTFESIEG